MAGKPPAYRTLPTDAPIWVSEPFRVFFPLGIAAGIMGLLLWPLHYAGWWPVYPALQHPRLLIFGFGAALLAIADSAAFFAASTRFAINSVRCLARGGDIELMIVASVATLPTRAFAPNVSRHPAMISPPMECPTRLTLGSLVQPAAS